MGSADSKNSFPTAPIPIGNERLLSKSEFQRLSDVPPEAEWFANLTNENTRRAYRNDVGSFMRFVGIEAPDEFRTVRRSHVIAWRKTLEARRLSAASIRRKMSALSDLFSYLCEKNAILDNPVHGVERPKEGANQGKTPALSDAQATELLNAPRVDSLKGKRDRAILAVLLYHAIRRAELCDLRVRDYGDREGIKHLTVRGKGGKIRFIPVHPSAGRLIEEYVDRAGHLDEADGPLFRSVAGNADSPMRRLNPGSVYRNVVMHYCRRVGISAEGIGPHALRATSATNALLNGADIAEVQEWLGHSSITTTRLYDRRKMQSENSPTFKIQYRRRGVSESN
jgi:site-specific recombinase XerD